MTQGVSTESLLIIHALIEDAQANFERPTRLIEEYHT